MAKPRVFISSTFYDLRHIRTDIERFVIDMGYDPVRNETGDIPYGVKEELEEYCYKEVREVDILIGIIGNRYGSNSKDNQHSITQVEINTAYNEGKQVYLFVDKSVYSEYQTYLLNKGTETRYSFVDNIKIFEFIEEIFAIKAGIIISPFENVSDITKYLKAQWAGLFRDLLRQSSENQQLLKLGSKIDDLESVTAALKNYLEISLPTLLSSEGKAETIIKDENEKLDEKKILRRMISLPFFKFLSGHIERTIGEIRTILINSETVDQFIKMLPTKYQKNQNFADMIYSGLQDINEVRTMLSLKPFILPPGSTWNLKYIYSDAGMITNRFKPAERLI